MIGTKDKIRIQHILNAILEIEQYTNDFDFEKFDSDSKTKFATIKQLEIIGEASNHISKETKLIFSEIEWRAFVNFRNILVHEYFGVNVEIIWNTVFEDLPKLKLALLQKLDSL